MFWVLHFHGHTGKISKRSSLSILKGHELKCTFVMLNRYPLYCTFLLTLTFGCGVDAADAVVQAKADIDVLTANRPHNEKDRRLDYSYELLALALEVTKEVYGDYELHRTELLMSRERQYRELLSGNLLNVMVSPPKPGWGSNVIRVKFPIQKGIASFRLAFVMEKNRHLLRGVSTLEDFRSVTLGANFHWSTTIVLRASGLRVVAGESYLSLFDMLEIGRFQLFPRGLNEIYPELEEFEKTIPGLIIEDHTAMVMYLPSYFYVSPETPRIAERLEVGLRIASRKGAFDKLFNKHFGDVVKRANLDKRKLIYLENPNIQLSMLEDDMPYLLVFFRGIER